MNFGFKGVSKAADVDNNSSSDQYSLEYEQQSREGDSHNKKKAFNSRASAALGVKAKSRIQAGNSSQTSSDELNAETNSPNS